MLLISHREMYARDWIPKHNPPYLKAFNRAWKAVEKTSMADVRIFF
jgi:hypothetical protein